MYDMNKRLNLIKKTSISISILKKLSENEDKKLSDEIFNILERFNIVQNKLCDTNEILTDSSIKEVNKLNKLIGKVEKQVIEK